MGVVFGADRLTLSFEDTDLEQRFQVATGISFAPQFRLGLSAGAALWVAAGFLLPRFSPVDDVRAGVLVALMTSVNLGALVLSRRFVTLDAQHALGTVEPVRFVVDSDDAPVAAMIPRLSLGAPRLLTVESSGERSAVGEDL